MRVRALPKSGKRVRGRDGDPSVPQHRAATSLRVQAGRIGRAQCAVVDMLTIVPLTSVNEVLISVGRLHDTTKQNMRRNPHGFCFTLSPLRHVVPFPAMKNLQSQLRDIFLFVGSMAPPCRAMALDLSQALCERPPRPPPPPPRGGPPCMFLLSFLFLLSFRLFFCLVFSFFVVFSFSAHHMLVIRKTR